MAVDDLSTLFTTLSGVFDLAVFHPHAGGDWLIQPVLEPDSLDLSDAEQERFGTLEDVPEYICKGRTNRPAARAHRLPRLRLRVPAKYLPYGPSPDPSLRYQPPPETYAFYMPFHFFYPEAWGIYIRPEGICLLAVAIQELADQPLPSDLLTRVSRFFLYKHECFHHQIESFATRLEVAHRRRVFIPGPRRLCNLQRGTDAWMEEGLANAFALEESDRALELAVKSGRASAVQRQCIVKALSAWILAQPPGYRRGVELRGQFSCQRNTFSENCLRSALKRLPPCDPALWNSFAYAYRGIANVTSRVNYIYHASGAEARRWPLGKVAPF